MCILYYNSLNVFIRIFSVCLLFYAGKNSNKIEQMCTLPTYFEAIKTFLTQTRPWEVAAILNKNNHIFIPTNHGIHIASVRNILSGNMTSYDLDLGI